MAAPSSLPADGHDASPGEAEVERDPFVSTRLDRDVRLRMGARHPEDRTPETPVQLLRDRARRFPHRTAMVGAPGKGGQREEWTYAEYLRDVEAAAAALVALGLRPRRAVAVAGFNSPRWFLADLGAVFAGGVAVGVYPTSSGEAARAVAVDAEADVVVAEDEAQVQKFLPMRDRLKALVQYGGAGPVADGVMTWEEFMSAGHRADESVKAESRGRADGVRATQCAHLVYTSGTEGPSKGVMLSGDSLTYVAAVLCELFEMGHGGRLERIVSYLPLSHVAANMVDIFVVMHCAGAIYFADKDALKGSLVSSLKEVEPTLFIAVPRVWEKIHEGMVSTGRGSKGLKKALVDWARQVGAGYNHKLMAGESIGVAESLQFQLANALVFNKVKAALGLSKCLRIFSSAAPISAEILEFFNSFDVRILEIYGMSECCGPQLTNTHGGRRIGALGRTLPGFHTRLGDGGEICMRGRNVMMGYKGAPGKTRAALGADGWLRSGDVGREDGDGFIAMSGRIKEMIVTAGGENVAPVAMEDAVKQRLAPLVSHAVLVGDRQRFVACLLSPKTLEGDASGDPALDPEALDWLRDHAPDSAVKTVSQLASDESVRAAVQRGVDAANAASAPSRAAAVRAFRFLPRELSLPGGELGPTLKVKRRVVLDKYAEVIQEIYS